MADQLHRLKAALAERYVVERELGAGGMATVYLAEDLKHHRKVAVKVLRPDLAATLGPDRFLREIEVAAQLTHPHILPLLDSGEASGFLYYVMPYVEGQSLRARIEQHGELPINEAVRLLRDIVDALGSAHARGIVHRDIKPDNVLLVDRHALVTDFGVAKAVSEATGRQKLTTAGVALGTPAYMAPEQASADPHMDHRADIYAVGALGYELLTGSPPFGGPTVQAVLAAHLTQAPEPVSARRASVPPALEAVLMRCLEKRPADRWQSTAELLAALETLATTPSGGMTPAGTLPLAAAAPSRIPRRAAAAALAVVILVVAVLVVRRLARPEESALDANVVAVAPINVLAPDLELWREGLVDVLSRNLDGAGPLRTVVPSVVLRAFSGTADAATADMLGHRTGAGLVVFGTLQRIGRDSVRLAATIRDVAQGATRGELDRSESADRMDRLADSISVDVLRQVISAGGEGRLRSMGTRSLPPLKEFLQGEQFYRRVQYDSAEAHFLRAIALDSTFALAYSGMAVSRGWTRAPGVGGFPQARPYALRAAALNRGLGARDSLRIAADSLYYELVTGNPPTLARAPDLWPNTRRLLVASEQLILLYSADPELLYRYADIRYHLGGPASGTTDQEVFEGFRRAVRTDSAFGPSYGHLIPLANVLVGPHLGVEYLRARDRHLGAGADATSPLREAILARSGADRSGLEVIVDSAKVSLLAGAYGWLLLVDDSASLFHRALTRLRRAATEGALGNATAVTGERQAAALLVSFGRLGSAARLAELRNTPAFAAVALMDGVPDETARAVFGGWLDGPRSPVDCLLALESWASIRDAASIQRCAARRVKEVLGDSLPGIRQRAAPISRIGEIFAALAGADTSRALALFEAFPDSLCPDFCWGIWRSHGRLLAARGRDREALTALLVRSHVDLAALRPFAVPLALDRARLAAKLGDVETAAMAYGVVAETWMHADDLLQPFVAEARRELQRLGRDAPTAIGVPPKN